MFAIIGIVVVFGCVVAGYLTEHGNMLVLLQPSELVMIGGAAIGTVLIANPLHILKSIAAGNRWCVWRFQIRYTALPSDAEDDVRSAEQSAQGVIDRPGERRGRA